MRVLVVDDSFSIINLITDFLQRMGVDKISQAENGQIGLEELRSHEDIKIVLSDLNMPQMNGMQFLKEAKRIRRDIAIIMMTSSEERVNVMKALHAGADDFILKPITYDNFKKKFDTVRKKHNRNST